MMKNATRNRAAAMSLAAAALALTGCVGQRAVTFEVKDTPDGHAVAGAHIRAIPLDTGATPLPLNEQTLDEILSNGKTKEYAFTDEEGRATLRLRETVPYLLEVQAGPVARDFMNRPIIGEGVWVLAKVASRIEPSPSAEPPTLALEVAR